MENRFTNDDARERVHEITDLKAANGSEGAPPRLAYSLRETAQMLGLCEKTIQRLIARRLIRRSTAIRHILIPKDEIERFLRDTRASD